MLGRVAIGLVFLGACESKSPAPPPPTPPVHASIDAAVVAKVAPDAMIDAAPPPKPTTPVIEPPTAESLHVELVGVFEAWKSNVAGRDTMYAKDFKQSHFLDVDNVPPSVDRKTWLDKVVGPVRVGKLVGVMCWLEAPDNFGIRREPQCTISFWYERPVGAAPVPYDSGSWELTLERATCGKWQIVDDEMSSRTRFTQTFSPIGGDDFVSAKELGKHLTLRWSSIVAPIPRLFLTLTDEKGAIRVTDIELATGPCVAAPTPPKKLLAIQCGTAPNVATFEVLPPAGDVLEVDRTPHPDTVYESTRFELAPHATVSVK